MYYRTHQTLSALSLTTRHNVGTRPFAANVRVNHGKQTLVVRHTLRGLMRDGMEWNRMIPQWASPIPQIPGSIFGVQQRPQSCVTRQRDSVVVGVRVEPEPRPANLADRLEPCDLDRGLFDLTTLSTLGSTAASKTDSRLRLFAKSSAKAGTKRTARRAAAAAALRATASGK